MAEIPQQTCRIAGRTVVATGAHLEQPCNADKQVTIMNTRPRSSTAERFGRWLGRGWRGYVRRERRAVAWLASVGVPSGAATALVWIVKLAVLGVLLYAAFWLALLLVFVTAAALGLGEKLPGRRRLCFHRYGRASQHAGVRPEPLQRPHPRRLQRRLTFGST